MIRVLIVDDEAPARARLRRLLDSTLEVEVEVGTDTIRMRDRVTNLGFDPTPHALLYHVNLGWPVVDY